MTRHKPGSGRWAHSPSESLVPLGTGRLRVRMITLFAALAGETWDIHEEKMVVGVNGQVTGHSPPKK